MYYTTHHFKSHGNGCYLMIVGSPLKARENGAIYLPFIVVHNVLPGLVLTFDSTTVEYNTRSGPSKRLVCCRGNHVGVFKR